jgi:hypothetical protein
VVESDTKWYQSRFQTLGMNGSPRPHDCSRKFYMIEVYALFLNDLTMLIKH